MGVGVTSTAAGTPYTWATAGFAWSDPECGQAWASIAPQAWALTAAEAWTTVEVGARGAAKALTDAWRTAEARGSALTKQLTEAWQTAHTYADIAQFHLRIMEAWATVDALGKGLPALHLAEAWSTAEASNRTPGKHVAEAWTTAEAFSRAGDFLRAFAESWSSVETHRAQYDLNVAELLELAEFYKRHANGVISDILLQAADMDLTDFQNAVEYGRAPGFSAFQEFTAGDYAYQSAVFRAVMQAATSDLGVIDALRLQVDVPDVFDSGTAQITTNPSAGVVVAFNPNRTFNIIPDVTLSVKGGTSLAAVPVFLVAPTKTGFTAALKDQNGTFYTGSLTWAARGY